MDKQIEIEMDIIRRKWKSSYYKYPGQDNLERGEEKMLWMLETKNNYSIPTGWVWVKRGRKEKEKERDTTLRC